MCHENKDAYDLIMRRNTEYRSTTETDNKIENEHRPETGFTWAKYKFKNFRCDTILSLEMAGSFKSVKFLSGDSSALALATDRAVRQNALDVSTLVSPTSKN